MENLVAIELAYINTKHPDFHKDAELVSLMMKSAEEEEFTRQRTLMKYNVNSTVNGCDKDVSPLIKIFICYCCVCMMYKYIYI